MHSPLFLGSFRLFPCDGLVKEELMLLCFETRPRLVVMEKYTFSGRTDPSFVIYVFWLSPQSQPWSIVRHTNRTTHPIVILKTDDESGKPPVINTICVEFLSYCGKYHKVALESLSNVKLGHNRGVACFVLWEKGIGFTRW